MGQDVPPTLREMKPILRVQIIDNIAPVDEILITPNNVDTIYQRNLITQEPVEVDDMFTAPYTTRLVEVAQPRYQAAHSNFSQGMNLYSLHKGMYLLLHLIQGQGFWKETNRNKNKWLHMAWN